MRIALILLIALHGIIHLFGFFKAFGISDYISISQPISKNYGVFWFLTFLLFAITTVLFLIHANYWWLSGFLAVIISQVLIFNYWTDAKFGTLANLMILLAAIIGYSSFNFQEKIKEERMALLENSLLKKQKIITENELVDLPPVVQKWLMNSGVIGKESISNVYLVQELQIKS